MEQITYNNIFYPFGLTTVKDEPQVIWRGNDGSLSYCGRSQWEIYQGQVVLHTANNIKEAQEYCDKFKNSTNHE